MPSQLMVVLLTIGVAPTAVVAGCSETPTPNGSAASLAPTAHKATQVPRREKLSHQRAAALPHVLAPNLRQEPTAEADSALPAADVAAPPPAPASPPAAFPPPASSPPAAVSPAPSPAPAPPAPEPPPVEFNSSG
jgi:hypothetical protein